MANGVTTYDLVDRERRLLRLVDGRSTTRGPVFRNPHALQERPLVASARQKSQLLAVYSNWGIMTLGDTDHVDSEGVGSIIDADRSPLTALALSPDGSHIAWARLSGVRWLDLANRKSILEPKERTIPDVRFLAFADESAESLWISSADEIGRVNLSEKKLEWSKQSKVGVIAKHPVKDLLLIEDRTGRLSAVNALGEVSDGGDCGRDIKALACHPEYSIAVTGDEYGTLPLWDWEKTESLCVVEFGAPISQVGFLNGGQELWCLSGGQLYQWDLSSDTLGRHWHSTRSEQELLNEWRKYASGASYPE